MMIANFSGKRTMRVSLRIQASPVFRFVAIFALALICGCSSETDLAQDVDSATGMSSRDAREIIEEVAMKHALPKLFKKEVKPIQGGESDSKNAFVPDEFSLDWADDLALHASIDWSPSIYVLRYYTHPKIRSWCDQIGYESTGTELKSEMISKIDSAISFFKGDDIHGGVTIFGEKSTFSEKPVSAPYLYDTIRIVGRNQIDPFINTNVTRMRFLSLMFVSHMLDVIEDIIPKTILEPYSDYKDLKSAMAKLAGELGQAQVRLKAAPIGTDFFSLDLTTSQKHAEQVVASLMKFVEKFLEDNAFPVSNAVLFAVKLSTESDKELDFSELTKKFSYFRYIASDILDVFDFEMVVNPKSSDPISFRDLRSARKNAWKKYTDWMSESFDELQFQWGNSFQLKQPKERVSLFCKQITYESIESIDKMIAARNPKIPDADRFNNVPTLHGRFESMFRSSKVKPF